MLAEREALLRKVREPLDLRAEFDPTYPENTVPRNDCAEAVKAIDAALSASAEPSAPTEDDYCPDGIVEAAVHGQIVELTSAPVEIDERAAFERWAKEHGLPVTRTPTALMFHGGQRREAGDYIAVETLCADAAWKARAALGRKP